MKISRLEHGNQAGSVTGTNFVVCSYGKFQPGRPRTDPRNTTKMVEHKLVSSSAVVALWTQLLYVTLLIKIIRILLKYIQDKYAAILAAIL